MAAPIGGTGAAATAVGRGGNRADVGRNETFRRVNSTAIRSNQQHFPNTSAHIPSQFVGSGSEPR